MIEKEFIDNVVNETIIDYQEAKLLLQKNNYKIITDNNRYLMGYKVLGYPKIVECYTYSIYDQYFKRIGLDFTEITEMYFATLGI